MISLVAVAPSGGIQRQHEVWSAECWCGPGIVSLDGGFMLSHREPFESYPDKWFTLRADNTASPS